MPETIGKYQIVARIGRGGMGTVFRAHDPILDRSVALKVISDEIDVTDELRARFYREAQACARLSHPNIITVYDMGEHEGRLFIVMELLDGEELKQIIATRRSLRLEDKLSVITQICEGLHYAHQKGVVHRDVKPGNIFLLRTGQVKILDFGIAQMATTEGALTKTGLIMGTLKYISPEQVRGRADHRSDMYSVGVVCYELLGNRLPFVGDDPIHLLEKLRSEEPTPLLEIDPSLPPDLASVIARAMRKDAAERFPDLGAMRGDLDKVTRRLADEAERTRGRLYEAVRQIPALRASLGERLGRTIGHPAVPFIDDGAGVIALQALEREIAAAIETLRSQVTRADSLAPAVRRATDDLDGGRVASAVAELEVVLAAMPEHALASELLTRARAALEAQQRRERVADLLDDARAMVHDEDYARAIELVDEASKIADEPDMARAIEALRQTAVAGIASQREAARAREHAEGLLAEVLDARRAAQQQETRYAPPLWTEAEDKLRDGQAALGSGDYAAARQALELALSGYRRFEEAARAAESEERQAAERARATVSEQRRQAHGSRASQYAAELLDAAEAKLTEGEAAMSGERRDVAARLFDDAAALYGEARVVSQRQHQEFVSKLLRDARAAVDRREYDRAQTILQEAEDAASDTDAAPEIELLRQSAAAGLAAQQAAERARAHTEGLLAQVDEAKDLAQEHPSRHAPALWNQAEATLAEGRSLFDQAAYEDAGRAFEQALASYRRFQEVAHAAEIAERQAAQESFAEVRREQDQAQVAQASQYAAELWATAATKLAEGEAAHRDGQDDRAAPLLREAAAMYRRALATAREARLREQRHAEDERSEAARAQQEAAATSAERLASALWQEAAAKRREGETSLAQEQFATAAERFAAARTLYHQASSQASEVRRREREKAERGQRSIAELRQAALAVDAPTHSRSDWSEAEAAASSGEASFRQEAYTAASQAFEHGAVLYRRALATAQDAQRALVDAGKRRDAAQTARRTAAESHAAQYASESWHAAEEVQARATAALGRQAYGEAQNLFVEARRLYASATRSARVSAEAESRRVDALMKDAQRLMDAGDFAGCLRQIDTVLRLRADHEPAQRLRQDAERELSRVAAVEHAKDETVLTTPSAQEVTIGVPHAPAVLAPDTGSLETVLVPTSTLDAAPDVIERGRTSDTKPTNESAKPALVAAELPASAAASAPQEPTGSAPGYANATETGRKGDRDDATITIYAPPRQLPGATQATPPQGSERVQPRRLGRKGWIAIGGAGAVAAALVVSLMMTGGKDPEVTTAPSKAQVPPGSPSSSPKPAPSVKAAQDVPAPKPDPTPEPPQVAQVPPREPAPLPTPSSSPSTAPQAPSVPATPPPAGPRLSEPSPSPAPPNASTSLKPPDKPATTAPPTLPAPAQRTERPAPVKPDVPAKPPQVVVTARDLSEAEQAQRAALDARQEATRAQAPRLAGPTFVAARDKQTDGDALLGQSNPSAAKQRFGEAQQLYRQATQQAVVALGREKTDAEQARGQMDAARRNAEQDAAEKFAASVLNAGRAKDRDGVVAFNQAEYGSASRLFREAQKAYEDARKEAVDQQKLVRAVAVAKGDTDQARRAVTARHDDAVKAEAPRLAKPAFDAAQAKQVEGDALANRESYAEATQAYKDAAERYRDAASRAAVARELRAQADSARDRMRTEKQRARENAPEFGSAQAEERLANGLYERLEFKGASEKFEAAKTLYTRAAAPPAPAVATPEVAPPRPEPPRPPDPPRPARPSRPMPPSF